MQVMCLKNQETDSQMAKNNGIFSPLLMHKYSFFTFLLFLRKPQDSIQYAKSKDYWNVPRDIF